MREAYGYIGDNLALASERISCRAERLGTPVPTLVAVTKSATDEEVRALVSCFGQHSIAENRTNLFRQRYALFEDGERPEMHLIGSLQTNKVKEIADKVAIIHSLDSLRLAAEIEKQAVKHGIRIRVLAEINSGREPAKGGVLPEDAEAFVNAVAEGFPHLALSGLMTMAPICESAEAYRPYFRSVARLYEKMKSDGLFVGTPVLSMGMSDSYEVAVEEGATLVRLGRTLFKRT